MKTLVVKVSPNARRSQILGWADHPDHGTHLRIQLAAPPVDGKANKALIAFLAKEWKTAKSNIQLHKGESSRFKRLRIPREIQLPPA
ncbi:DUF167 domain-containing protein [Roseibacillus persicicus]|uniref:DUF167 domain-containing protein n=1 Tax=Roseibacillus persicicus TaxID=454148 RepID=UPI00280EE396|nr:DUF167 domain-containing protein [Roseibacillus persicicus]MDQ8189174.1 DUF167 domain-containing protein [Roseibacillus persicicus]